jgi:FG-GAP-like repeat/FG-GAP repeat
MKKKYNNSTGASAFPTTYLIALMFASWILLTSAAVATPVLGNYPNTSLLLSADTTVTPDAPPAVRVKINVSTSSDFKGTLEGDPTTGIVRVTNAHPAGTYTVTVTALDRAGETASRRFRLRVTMPATCNPVSFAAAVNLYDYYPYSVAVGDFNEDGKQDLAASGFVDNRESVLILLGDGAGNFSTGTNFTTGISSTIGVAVGDFNGDGKQDLVTANNSSFNVSILLGDGTGNFDPAINFDAGYGPYSVAVADFNCDGKQDLAVANHDGQNVSILLRDCPAGRSH